MIILMVHSFFLEDPLSKLGWNGRNRIADIDALIDFTKVACLVVVHNFSPSNRCGFSRLISDKTNHLRQLFSQDLTVW